MAKKIDPDDVQREHGSEHLLHLADVGAQTRYRANGNGNGGNVVTFRVRNFREVIAAAEPIRWIIPLVLQRGMIYSLTARYGAGKSTLAVLLSLLVGARQLSIERKFGPYAVRKGRVLAIVNENRKGFERMLLVAAEHYGVADADICVVDGLLSLATDFDALKALVGAGPWDLVLIDTAFSLFEGKEENSNKEMLDHARKLRRFVTDLAGDPSVIALAHPAKHAAAREELVPRGGSSFTAELDGNFILWKDDESGTLEFGEAGKMRGPGNILIRFEVTAVHHARLDDADGTPGHAPVATLVSDEEADQRADDVASTETKALEAVAFAGETGLRQSAFAEMAGVHRSTAKRVLDALVKKGLVEKHGSRYVQQTAQQPRNKRRKYATDDDRPPR